MKFKVQVIRTHLFCMYNTIMQLMFNVLELVFWNTRHVVVIAGAGQSTGSWLFSATTYSFQTVWGMGCCLFFILVLFFLSGNSFKSFDDKSRL